ncbi:MAG: ribosome maturation factor RimP, partial [Gaiellales bacterium]
MSAAADPREQVVQLIREARPEIYVWDVIADAGHGQLRVMIDREGGVDLGVCEDISKVLLPLREEWALEVSSPGLDRALTRPEHYARMVGREAAFVMRVPFDGHTSFEGVLAAAGPESVTVETG